MLGKTHITVGIAAALAVTHPETVPGCITAMVGGAIGGWFPDIDCKDIDIDKETGLDTIIDLLFIGAFIVVDYLVGTGMCQYVMDNWGVVVWGSLFGIVIFGLIGYLTNHRTFTHSLVGMVLFGALVLFFCRPVAIPFVIGYSSHLFVDMFNKLGLQLFFPFKWRPCWKVCASNKRANRVLFWVALTIDMVLGAFLFANALIKVNGSSELVLALKTTRILGLNSFQIYLIFINLLTFLGFQRNWKYRSREFSDDEDVIMNLEFEIWVLDFLAFIGGGIGMFIALFIHLLYPQGPNANWWAFCYTSILFWTTIYFYICNPFGLAINRIQWLSINHLPILVYIIGINAVSALLFYAFRKKHFGEYSLKHTLLFMIGAAGGTLGAIPVVIATHHQEKFNYAVVGFFTMLVSQIVFVLYMMAAGIL